MLVRGAWMALRVRPPASEPAVSGDSEDIMASAYRAGGCPVCCCWLGCRVAWNRLRFMLGSAEVDVELRQLERLEVAFLP